MKKISLPGPFFLTPAGATSAPNGASQGNTLRPAQKKKPYEQTVPSVASRVAKNTEAFIFPSNVPEQENSTERFALNDQGTAVFGGDPPKPPPPPPPGGAQVTKGTSQIEPRMAQKADVIFSEDDTAMLDLTLSQLGPELAALPEVQTLCRDLVGCIKSSKADSTWQAYLPQMRQFIEFARRLKQHPLKVVEAGTTRRSFAASS
ncbi:hypothetical protein PLESTM_000869600 [Pleodorina starrii]|nr:hypothetical protein PLESTM_000869600 [Pleodorina starrii]